MNPAYISIAIKTANLVFIRENANSIIQLRASINNNCIYLPPFTGTLLKGASSEAEDILKNVS